MRHPELHQNPEIFAFKFEAHSWGQIEVGQHTDGRWMWAYTFSNGSTGSGFCLSAKWARFTNSRDAALKAAVNEISKRAKLDNRLHDWLNQFTRPQLAFDF